MATVKGILVNDGGAPARIINFKAGEAISAGEVLKPSTAADMTCLLATNQNPTILHRVLPSNPKYDRLALLAVFQVEI